MFEVPMFEWANHTSARSNIGIIAISNIGMFKHWHYSYSYKNSKNLKGRVSQSINVPTSQHIFECLQFSNICMFKRQGQYFNRRYQQKCTILPFQLVMPLTLRHFCAVKYKLLTPQKVPKLVWLERLSDNWCE